MPFAVPDDLPVDAARVADTRRRLEEAGVQHCYAAFVDVHGVPKSKAAPLACFEKMCAGGELYTVGANEGLGLAGPHEDECAAVPDLDSAIVFPWDPTQAFFAADLWYRGAPYANDPRGFLRRTAERARAMGFVPMLGIEPELYVLRRGPDGALEPITASRFRGPNACYDLNLTTESMDFLGPMRKHLEALGWGLYSFDQECGRGQYEFDFGYADAVTMADRFTFFRLMAKKVAQSIGAVASFMPKPFADDFRSGAHFNLSLAHVEGGANAFAEPPGALARAHGVAFSDTALHFTAGMLATRARSPRSAAPPTTPTRASSRAASCASSRGRRCSRSGAATTARRCSACRATGSAWKTAPSTWRRTRTSPPRSRSPRGSRASSGSSIRARARRTTSTGSPGGSSPPPASARSRPRLLHAIEAFESDPLVEEVFGAEFRDLYATLRRREWEEVFYHVSDWQRARDLDFL